MLGRGKRKPGEQNRRVHLQAIDTTLCMRLGFSQCGLKEVFASALTKSTDLVTCEKCRKILASKPQLGNKLRAERVNPLPVLLPQAFKK
jgi:hypothetical protein